jgi:hypothetical protein
MQDRTLAHSDGWHRGRHIDDTVESTYAATALSINAIMEKKRRREQKEKEKRYYRDGVEIKDIAKKIA